MKRTTYEQFDLVRITTTRNIEWRMELPGQESDPNGVWSVVCTYPKTGYLLIQKAHALVRVPASDVIKVANFSIEKVFDQIDQSSRDFLRKAKVIKDDEEEQEDE